MSKELPESKLEKPSWQQANEDYPPDEPQNSDVSKKDKLTHIDTEPQSWEQRLREYCDEHVCICELPENSWGRPCETCPLKSFLRAEIERVREDMEHEVCKARQEGYVRGLNESREQNKHRGTK